MSASEKSQKLIISINPNIRLNGELMRGYNPVSYNAFGYPKESYLTLNIR